MFHGPPGLEPPLVAIKPLANELKVIVNNKHDFILDKPGDLAGLLTNLEDRDVLFIDEIHRLNPIVEEYLYSAMEDYQIDIMIESGPNARSVQIKINPLHFNWSYDKIWIVNCSNESKVWNYKPIRILY